MPKLAPLGLHWETPFWRQGQEVAGVDEAGRGAWAGPVVAAAVLFPSTATLPASLLARIHDSKQLRPRQREELLPLIQQVAMVGVGMVAAAEIDRLGIMTATLQAMQGAVAGLPTRPDHLLIDYIPYALGDWPQQRIKRGDAQVLSIAAASIVAKVTRDRWMVEVAEQQWPGYGFGRHKGYGTAAHREALARLGPSPIHRRTWAPLRQPRLF